MKCEYETVGNNDIWKSMLGITAMDRGYPRSSKYTNFIGRVTFVGKTYYIANGAFATNLVVELTGGATIAAEAHDNRQAIGGLAGNCEVRPKSRNTDLWVGSFTEDQLSDFLKDKYNATLVVAGYGRIEPGVVDWDGGRRGSISVPFEGSTSLPNMSKFSIISGGTLATTLRPDGTSTYVDATKTYSSGYNTSVTLDGANLEVNAVGKIPVGVEYPVLKYHTGKLTGEFATVTPGYDVKYDAELSDDLRAVVVSRKRSGLIVVFR